MTPCVLNEDPQRIIPDWKIIKQSTNGTVISEKRIMGYEIKNVYDSLVWIWDFNNSKNNVLLIGPVDKTLDISIYQCFYTQCGAIDTLRVAGEYMYVIMYVIMYVFDAYCSIA